MGNAFFCVVTSLLPLLLALLPFLLLLLLLPASLSIVRGLSFSADGTRERSGDSGSKAADAAAELLLC